MHCLPLPSAPLVLLLSIPIPAMSPTSSNPLPISLPYRPTLLLQLHFYLSLRYFPFTFPTFSPTSFSHPFQDCHGQVKTKIFQGQGKVRKFLKKSWKFFDIVKVSEKSGNLLALRTKSSQKRKEVENEEKNISGLQRKLKQM